MLAQYMDHQVVLSVVVGVKHSLCSFGAALRISLQIQILSGYPASNAWPCRCLHACYMAVSRCANLCQICGSVTVDAVPSVTVTKY